MTVGQPVSVAVLGLGEAGSEFARHLVAAGAEVHGFDPEVAAPPGVIEHDSDAAACETVGIVLALTSAHEARETLALALPGIGADTVYADLNTASAGLKVELAGLAAASGADFVDVALMSPVPGKGLRTPMVVSGSASETYATQLRALGASVEIVVGPPGAAATRKLVRSVYYKGLAAAVVEALRAGRAAGCEDWLRENIATELAQASAATVDRLIDGSVRHARRRIDEMAAATELLTELGIEPRIAHASELWLRQLLAESTPACGTRAVGHPGRRSPRRP